MLLALHAVAIEVVVGLIVVVELLNVAVVVVLLVVWAFESFNLIHKSILKIYSFDNLKAHSAF